MMTTRIDMGLLGTAASHDRSLYGGIDVVDKPSVTNRNNRFFLSNYF